MTPHVPVHPVRFVTVAGLFDGHDAAISIMRRILEAQGAEVVHLGHDRSVAEVVDAVLEEAATPTCPPSRPAWKRFSRATARRWRARSPACRPSSFQRLTGKRSLPRRARGGCRCSVSRGQGGSVKSSLTTDELIRLLRTDRQDTLRVTLVAIRSPTRRRGGVLLGDRIRMNSLAGSHVYFRSLATRGAHELPDNIEDIIGACKAGYYLVIVETPGIGHGDAGVRALATCHCT